jgi:hypothetical protein
LPSRAASASSSGATSAYASALVSAWSSGEASKGCSIAAAAAARPRSISASASTCAARSFFVIFFQAALSAGSKPGCVGLRRSESVWPPGAPAAGARAGGALPPPPPPPPPLPLPLPPPPCCGVGRRGAGG